uniref:Myelin basic protein n=1 Tax=Meleagris gallopavo TaxID=9103 RepID=A0A803XPK0_MELGA
MQQLHRALSIHSSQYLYLLSLSPQLLVSFLPADQTLLLLQDIHAARASHVGSIPQRSQHGRPGDDNPVVHFFKNIVSSTSSHYVLRLSFRSTYNQISHRHKPGYGSGKFYEHKSAHKGHKGSYHEGQGTLSKIFKLEIPSLQLGSPLLEKL